jgi:hypothetical protein
MIRILCATAVAIACMTIDQRPAHAYEAPWCAVIDFGAGDAYWDCQYRSLEECVPNVLAGNRGFCNENPRFHGAEQPRRQPKHPRRHSHAQ